MATVRIPKRGEVWLIRFDPSVGAEIRKIRPAVAIPGDQSFSPGGVTAFQETAALSPS